MSDYKLAYTGTQIDEAITKILSSAAQILGYKVLSGTYTPTEKITSPLLVHTTKTISRVSSTCNAVSRRTIGFSFLVTPDSGTTTDIVYPTTIYSFACVSNVSSYSANSASSGTTSLIKAPFIVSNYCFNIYLPASSYPLQVGNTYAWILLYPKEYDL